jgi:hypothetical protein
MLNPIVFGENLASAVFAFERRRAELDVSIALDKPVNTQFSGVPFGDLRVDRGMVLIELERPGIKAASLERYKGEYRSQAVPYLGCVSGWFHEVGLNYDVTCVETFFRGEFIKDFFISDSLEIFGLFTEVELSVIRRELESSSGKFSSMNHPKNKTDNTWYETTKYLEVAQLIFGNFFTHSVIVPFLFKLYGEKLSELIASEHRSAWVPVFYPESLLLSVKGDETLIDEKVFHYPIEKGFAEFVYSIEKTVNESVPRASIGQVNIMDSSSYELSPEQRAVFFGSPKMISGIKTLDTQICSGKNVYIQAKASSSRTVFIVDSEIDAFRVNVRPGPSLSDGYVSIEFGSSALEYDDTYLIRQSLELCDRCNVQIYPGTARVIDTKLPLRIGQSRSLSSDLKKLNQELRAKAVLGYPICEVNGAINDQLCAALGSLTQFKDHG